MMYPYWVYAVEEWVKAWKGKKFPAVFMNDGPSTTLFVLDAKQFF